MARIHWSHQKGLTMMGLLSIMLLFSACTIFFDNLHLVKDPHPDRCGPIVDPVTGEEHWPCQTYLVDPAHPELGSKCKLIYENRTGCNNCPACRCHSVQTNGVWSCPCNTSP